MRGKLGCRLLVVWFAWCSKVCSPCRAVRSVPQQHSTALGVGEPARDNWRGAVPEPVMVAKALGCRCMSGGWLVSIVLL